MSYLADNATTKDGLEFEHFQVALKEIAAEAQTPLTVGVFGPWGSGKTSLMRMLRSQVEADNVPSVRSVWFTAWKYDRQEALWRAFILRVLDALYPRVDGEGPREERPILDADEGSDEAKLIALLGKLEQSVYQAVDWEEIGPRSINWWQFLGGATKAGLETAATLASFGFFPQVKSWTGADDTPVDEIRSAAQAISRETQHYHRRQLFHMEEFEAMFQEAIGLLKPRGKARLIVFVDDLDRCLPEKALQVLEAIKLFLEVPGVVFILGMDKAVVQQGIEARYGQAFGEKKKDGRDAELPISGDSYLQKIVQIPFHLPALAMEDVEKFIDELDTRLSPMTRAVFARGLYPNPRQVKRALNIFRLLRTIADQRFAADPDAIADPLLAKTVLIQTQFPDLYQLWRQYPTVVQTLETEYERRVVTEEELLRGRSRPAVKAEGAVRDAPEAAARPGADEKGDRGLLHDYLTERARYALLARLLTYPPADKAGEGADRARFAGLERKQLAAYVRLAGAVEAGEDAPVDLPTDLLAALEDLLSGEAVRVQDAVARVQQTEDDPDGRQQEAVRRRLVQVLQDPARPTGERLSAGDALADLGDPRFHDADGFCLPREEMLGFVEVPAGNFRMGSGDDDPDADADEKPQHTLHLPAFYIARYPVTVAQFRVFVERSGHKPADKDRLQGAANHPVVWVSWHDGMAYCRWLDQQLRNWDGAPPPLRTLLQNGHRVILPSEAEWEKAARGSGGLRYPWGNEFDPQQANHKGTGRGSAAVGCFPNGASPYGALDMSGNVWEWTRSIYGEWDSEKSEVKNRYRYAYDSGDGREDLDKGNEWLRVLRGGSFYNDPDGLRCAARRGSLPHSPWNGGYGFRMCVSPFT